MEGLTTKTPSLLTLLGCPRKSGSKVGINGLFHLLKNGIYRGYNSYKPLILTFDPNFLGHPSNPMENSNDLSRFDVSPMKSLMVFQPSNVRLLEGNEIGWIIGWN